MSRTPTVTVYPRCARCASGTRSMSTLMNSFTAGRSLGLMSVSTCRFWATSKQSVELEGDTGGGGNALGKAEADEVLEINRRCAMRALRTRRKARLCHRCAVWNSAVLHTSNKEVRHAHAEQVCNRIKVPRRNPAFTGQHHARHRRLHVQRTRQCRRLDLRRLELVQQHVGRSHAVIV